MKLLHLTTSWFAIIQLFLVAHFYIIEYKKKTPMHGLSFLMAFGLAIVISYFTWDTLTFFIISILYLGFMYWIVFPVELNFFRKKPILRLGTASWFDRMEASMRNPGMTLGMKIILMIMCSFILLDL